MSTPDPIDATLGTLAAAIAHAGVLAEHLRQADVLEGDRAELHRKAARTQAVQIANLCARVNAGMDDLATELGRPTARIVRVK